MRPVTKQTITQYNQNDYDVLRTYLFSNLGAYCSYCEQPIGNDSAVEHKVPQSTVRGFRTRATQWRNLLIACQSCNSTKSAKPDKRDVPNHSNDTETWYMETLNLWVWPDRNPNLPNQPAPPVDQTYRLFRYERSARTQEWLYQQGLLRKPWGVNAPAWAQAPQTKTWVMPDDTYIGTDAALRQRVLNTIVGLNLNLNNTDDPGYNDRRVDNRDAAYLTAQTALTHLHTVYAGSNRTDVDRVILTVQAIREAALASGFWSIWFMLFRAALDNPVNGTPWYGVPKADREELLARSLLYYYPAEQNGNGTVPLFPGTDDTRLNLGAFQ